ncbi:MAG: class I SAM-dependent methyltransferase [Anaerolineae bacterium]
MSTQGVCWDFLYQVDPTERWNAHFTLMIWKAFRQFIIPGSRALEIGCGPASLAARSVLELSCQSIASDIDPMALDYAGLLAQTVGADIKRIRANGFCLPFHTGAFDTVFSSGVIEHFPCEQTERMVAEHARVYKVGGHVLLAVPNLLNPVLTYHKLRTGRRYHAYPERSYTVWGLAELMRRHGLRPIGYTGFAPTIGFEWFIHSNFRLRWVDRHAPNWFLALFGYEVLVAAKKVE